MMIDFLVEIFFEKSINDAFEEGRNITEQKIGLLRQYLNERPSKELITDEELKKFLV